MPINKEFSLEMAACTCAAKVGVYVASYVAVELGSHLKNFKSLRISKETS